MQTAGKNVRWKRNSIILTTLLFVVFACMVLFSTVFPTEYERCEYYNEQLGGGEKTFEGKTYRINLCGTGGDGLQNGDRIRLQIFNKQNNLLAVRYFMIDWDSNTERNLKYHADSIMYFDASVNNNYKKTVHIPPTVFDWIRARTPLLN